MNFYPVILSGGAGSRLWPISREFFPKPLLPIIGENTLLQNTVLRLSSLPNVKSPTFVCNEEHRFLVMDQIEAIGIQPLSVFLEPSGRNTAPALTIAAMHLVENDPDAILVVMPADHVIPDEIAFSTLVEKAGEIANDGYLVTFGIVPDKPETGYGYINKGESIDGTGGYGVRRFVEKPDLETAMDYLESGDYFWNGGIFVLRADAWLKEIASHRPLIHAACRTSMNSCSRDDKFIRVSKEAFMTCPSESIDYAVMENTNKAAVLPMNTHWSDIGSWSSIWELSEKDSAGNATKGDVLAHGTSNSLLFSESRCIAAVGLENLVVVETADAILIADKNKSQDVKAIVSNLKEKAREEYRFHSRVHRPWGNYEGIDNGKRYQVKRITVKPGGKLSLQMHHHRAEHWIVVSGTAKVTVGEKQFFLSENESTFIPLGETHRLENPGTIPLELIEVQSGSYLGEDDIVRFEDIYKRVGESQIAS